jgi:dipeptidyl aminopeptidase/acylaminoacyl peptidase
VFDFFNRNNTRWDWPLIPNQVMKARPEEDPERYRLASPIDQVGEHAPPFLVVHGSNDSLVPPPEARQFVTALEAVSDNTVEYLEVPGGQHAFDAVASPRTRAVVTRITSFLERVMASDATRRS